MRSQKLHKTPGISTAMIGGGGFSGSGSGGRLVRCTAGDALTADEQRFADECLERIKTQFGYEPDVSDITHDDVAAPEVATADKEAHLCGHSERLVLVKVAFASKQAADAAASAKCDGGARAGESDGVGDGDTFELEPIRITKNLRICRDCHRYTALMARLLRRRVLVRDANRWHAFSADGEACSCNDFW
jgi:hypothetical protein